MENPKTERIIALCLTQNSKNPIQIARQLMHDPIIAMHGPEHHFLDGAALLTAVHHSGVEFDLTSSLEELLKRSSQMPGAICGHWGVCGSAASVGAALSILHHSGPLSHDQGYQNNLLATSQILNEIAKIGGPRCCKRNAFIALKTAIGFLKEKEGICLEDEPVSCEFYPHNAQCLGQKCPFHP